MPTHGPKFAHRLIWAFILVLWPAAHAAGQGLTRYEIAGQAIVSEFGRWTATGSGTIHPGLATLTIEPTTFTLPNGTPFVPFAPGVPIQITDGAASEVILPTAVSCPSDQAICTVTGSFRYSHSGHVALSSADDGLQEAINFVHGQGGGTVVLNPAWTGGDWLPQATGFADTQLEDTRAGSTAWYAWTGGAYEPTLSVDSPAGTVSLARLDDIRLVAGFPGSTPDAQVAAAIADVPANEPGFLLVSPEMGPGGAPGAPDNISALDLRLGTPAAPDTDRSFNAPNVLLRLYDASPASSNPGAQGDASIVPMVRLEGTESGGATLTPLYFFGKSEAGATGSLYGMLGAVDAQTGARDQVIANDLVAGDDEEYNIAAIARSGGVVTATLASTLNAPNSFQDGDCIHVSGATDASFDSGRICFTVTSVLGDQISWDQPGPDASPAPGGTLALGTQFFGLELDNFNDAMDPTPLTPIVAENVAPSWGVTSTSNGKYPVSGLFFADGPAYNGYVCQDAISACFVAGYPVAGAPALKMTYGFLNRPLGVATAAANANSAAVGWQDSVWNGGSFQENSFTWQAVPGSGANAASSLVAAFNGQPLLNLAQSGQLQLTAGGPASPALSFSAGPSSGLFLDPGGRVGIAVGGAEDLAVGSGGLQITDGGATAALVPTGNATLDLPAASGVIATTTSALAPTSLSINGDAPMTAAPRMVWSSFLPGALTASWTAATWTPDRAITVTRVQVQAKTPPVGCATPAVITVGDGTHTITLGVAAAANDSGPLQQAYAAGTPLTISVAAAAGCSTPPGDANAVVEYAMQ